MAGRLSQRGPPPVSIPLLADQKNIKNKRKPCMHEARTSKNQKKHAAIYFHTQKTH